MPRQRKSADVFVAKNGFACVLNGEHIIVNKGEYVRAGHELLRRHGDEFSPVDRAVHYDVEQATAAPGEVRGEIRVNPMPRTPPTGFAVSEK